MRGWRWWWWLVRLKLDIQGQGAKKYFDVDGQGGGGVGLEVIQGHHMCIVHYYLLTQRVQYLRRHILLEQWDIMSKKFIS